MKRISVTTSLILLVVLLAVSCSKNPAGPEVVIPDTPEQLDDGLEVSSLFAQGLDPEMIQELHQLVRNGNYGNVHSMLILRNGFLVFEEYYRGWEWDQNHLCYSVTKSVTSALIGMAFDRGFLDDLDRPIADFFPEYAAAFDADPGKREITLRHVLTMTSGLEYDEMTLPFNDPNNSWTAMHASNDWIGWVLESPLVETPGSVFNYNSGCTLLLAGILRRVTGQHADDLAEEWLFGPMGISGVEWNHEALDPASLPDTGGGLYTRPRDMAKFGMLYSSGGVWDGQRLLAQEWVDASLDMQVVVDEDRYLHYGYQWWVQKYFQIPEPGVTWWWTMPFAAGYNGQLIVLVPAEDVMLVFTAQNGWEGVNFLDIVFNHIYDAIYGTP